MNNKLLIVSYLYLLFISGIYEQVYIAINDEIITESLVEPVWGEGIRAFCGDKEAVELINIPTTAGEFIGNWTNTNINTQFSPYFFISEACSKLVNHSFGTCVPANCDWGYAYTENSIQHCEMITFIWNQCFVINYDTLRLIDDNLIERTVFVQYVDNSGRQDRTIIENYYRSTCKDGLQNGDETRIDQGGIHCNPENNIPCESMQEELSSQNFSSQLSIIGSAFLCFEEATLLSANHDYISYIWTTGATAKSINVNQEGMYGLTVTDGSGCIGEYSIEVAESPILALSIQGISSFCKNNSTVLSADTTYSSYEWTTGSLEKEIIVSQAGIYSLTVTDNSGCTDSTSILIEEIQIGSSCDDNEEETENDQIQEDCSCMGFAQEAIDCSDFKPTITGDSILCKGETILLSMDQLYNNYLWSNGVSETTINVSESGEYSLTVTNELGCEGTASIRIKEGKIPEETAVACQVSANEVNFIWESNEEVANYEVNLLSDGEGQLLDNRYSVAEVTPNEEVEIELTAISTFGNCETTTVHSCTSSEKDVIVPEILTPNGDGKNDVLIIDNIEDFPKNEILIFNRWGQIVLKKKPYQNNWDGRNQKGQVVPDGTYYYILRLDIGEGKIQEGRIAVF